MKIKNIILDLGGVLLDIDYNLTATSFENMGFSEFKNMYSQYTADPLFENLETGKVSNEEFYWRMQEISKNVTVNQITQAWNAMLLDFRFDSFNFLEKLAKDYNIFLLSNTNAIHHAAFSFIFHNKTNRSLDSYFKNAYYSHIIGFRKPNEDIFDFVMEDASLKPEETLFVDDSFNNIETAHRLKWKTHLLKKGEVIEKILPKIIQGLNGGIIDSSI